MLIAVTATSDTTHGARTKLSLLEGTYYAKSTLYIHIVYGWAMGVD